MNISSIGVFKGKIDKRIMRNGVLT